MGGIFSRYLSSNSVDCIDHAADFLYDNHLGMHGLFFSKA